MTSLDWGWHVFLLVNWPSLFFSAKSIFEDLGFSVSTCSLILMSNKPPGDDTILRIIVCGQNILCQRCKPCYAPPPRKLLYTLSYLVNVIFFWAVYRVVLLVLINQSKSFKSSWHLFVNLHRVFEKKTPMQQPLETCSFELQVCTRHSTCDERLIFLRDTFRNCSFERTILWVWVNFKFSPPRLGRQSLVDLKYIVCQLKPNFLYGKFLSRPKPLMMY